MVEAGRRGHIPSALSPLEILRVLYDEVLRYDAKNPLWKDRDRCILSKGHGCLSLYVLLAEKGFFPEAELWKYCKSDGILGGHPERGKVPGNRGLHRQPRARSVHRRRHGAQRPPREGRL